VPGALECGLFVGIAKRVLVGLQMAGYKPWGERAERSRRLAPAMDTSVQDSSGPYRPRSLSHAVTGSQTSATPMPARSASTGYMPET